MNPFTKTRAALDAYDTYVDQVWSVGDNSNFGRNFDKLEAERERLARAVGRAFGEDTADVNSPETCERCVRPGDVRRFLIKESWIGVPA